MAIKIEELVTIEEGRTKGRKKISAKHADFVPACIARIEEIIKLIKTELGGVQGWFELGVNKQMRFAIKHGIDDSELPMISASFFQVGPEAWKDALKSPWQFKEADLRDKFEKCKTPEEVILFSRAWALDSARALFMRSLRSYASEKKFQYDAEWDRDLRFKNAWMSKEEADQDSSAQV